MYQHSLTGFKTDRGAPVAVQAARSCPKLKSVLRRSTARTTAAGICPWNRSHPPHSRHTHLVRITRRWCTRAACTWTTFADIYAKNQPASRCCADADAFTSLHRQLSLMPCIAYAAGQWVRWLEKGRCMLLQSKTMSGTRSGQRTGWWTIMRPS